MTTTDFYEILQVSPDASPLDIKKAYRRLALQHHPDRNNGSAESTERFKLISEAFQVLSDPAQRRTYDQLRSQPSPSSPTSTFRRHTPTRPHRDAFSQFDDLFHNDPFFSEAFQDMDDEFSRRFQNSSTARSTQPGWLPWLLERCGIQFQMTTYTSTGNGSFAATSYNSQPRGGGYTDKKTRTYRDAQGRQITVQSMERNGNRIEDKYLDGQLMERRVNNVLQPLEQIQNHG